jgi:histidinol-phosphate phosphatase family protein
MGSLSTLPAKIVLVTNQSAVGRGLISLHEAIQINDKILLQIHRNGGRIDGIYLCPHAPSDLCFCRKPNPGMLLNAAQDLQIDLKRSVMIGDALTDIAAGKNARTHQNLLLLSGRGTVQSELPEALKLQPFLVYSSLMEAVEDYKEWWTQDETTRS